MMRAPQEGRHETSPPKNFCIWPRALPRCRRCRASLGRKPIRRGRCVGSSAFPPAAEGTSWRVSWHNGCRNGSASHSSSRTGQGPAPISPPRRSCAHHRTAIRCSITSTPAAINATLYNKLNFNFIQDIAPIASITRSTYVMAVHPSVPAKTVREFIAYAKANPGKINMASAGNGTPQHLSGELFKIMAGVNMIHVPYRGDAPALTDLLAGQVQICFTGTVSSMSTSGLGRCARWR